MTTSTLTWSPSYTTAPPPSCQTLRNYRNTVAWGQTCVFAEEDGGRATPFSINTACMPWVTPGVYPSPGAVYGPATACPSSWSAVSTATSGADVELSCCPPGFEGDGRSGCRVKADSGRWSVVQCGDADAEENENRVYEAGQWPASATVSVDALRLRGAGSASASASATGSSPTSTAGSSGNVGGGGGGGLSTAAKAAIGTVIPLVFMLGALALLVLWRRRKHKKAALALAKINMVDEKPAPSSSTSKRGSYHQPCAQQPALDSKTISIAAATAGVGRTGPNTHEIPEWNVEMDATDAERQRLVPQDPLSATSNGTEASELGGIARMPRKPIAPVELDGTSARAEVGDAYLPYRPGVT